MAAYLGIPVKSSQEVDFAKPLRTFILSNYTCCKPEDYEKAIPELNKLRAQALVKFLDKHESSLDVVYRYFDQLCAIEAKLPMTEDQIRVNFKWQDAFTKGSFLSGKGSLTVPLGSFEKACVLFNIAALQSQVAAVQSRDMEEGLKLAAKLFQQSAGILRYLKDGILSMLQRDPTADLNPDTLNALSALMLAQAQESIYYKASSDKMKDGVIARIAMQCSDLYADCLKLMQLYSVKDVWPKDWISVVAGKQAAFHGLAEYYQSGVAKSDKAYGEEIARLTHARDLTLAGVTRGGREVDFQSQLSKIEQSLQAAKKDNDFIYHDKIADLKSLPSIQKAVLAKATPFVQPLSAKFIDLFEKLVPLHVSQALQAFDNRKSAVVSTEVGRLREATVTLNGVLTSLNLPAAIEDLTAGNSSGGAELPPSVKEKAEKVREMGGTASITNLIQELPQLLTRNKELLDEADRMLEEEERSDRQLREQFHERWTRMPSGKLTESVRADGAKYRTILSNAVEADAVVRSKYDASKRGFDLLSMPPSQLAASIPAANRASALSGSASVGELRLLMSQVDAIRTEREVTENELKNASFDMTSKFMAALAQDGVLNDEAVSASELDRIYAPLREQVSESLRRQEAILEQVQRNSKRFDQERALDQTASRREELLREMAAAYDSFMELHGNLQEGTKFYGDLTEILVKYQNKISDLCFARKTEKEELLKDLQQEIAGRPAQPAPPVPAYQQQQQQLQQPPPPQPSVQQQLQPSRPPPPVPAARKGTGKEAPVAPPTVPPPASVQQQPPQQQQLQHVTGAPQPPPSYGAAAAPGHVLPYPAQSSMPYPAQPVYYGPPVPGGYNPFAQYGGAGAMHPGGAPAYYPGYPPQVVYPAYQGYPMQQPPAQQQQPPPHYSGYPGR